MAVFGNIMFSSATQPPPPRPNFVVSAITFEGFRLRSSNLIHALLIQISRTSSIIDIVVPSKMAAGGHFVKKSKKKLRIVLKWPEMRSKVICGHPKWPPGAKLRIDVKWPEMRSKDDFRTSKMATGSHFVKNKNLYWSKMARNVIQSEFGHPKWPTAAICKHFTKIKVLYWSKMARNATESDFRTSKMAAGSHFVKKITK